MGGWEGENKVQSKYVDPEAAVLTSHPAPGDIYRPVHQLQEITVTSGSVCTRPGSLRNEMCRDCEKGTANNLQLSNTVLFTVCVMQLIVGLVMHVF